MIGYLLIENEYFIILIILLYRFPDFVQKNILQYVVGHAHAHTWNFTILKPKIGD